MEIRKEAHEHPDDGSTTLSILKSRLPESLPLYRRVQSAKRTIESHIFATFSPSLDVSDLPRVFAIAFVDRSTRPETELFLYLSCPEIAQEDDIVEQTAAVRAILVAAAALSVKVAPVTATAISKYAAHLTNTNLILAGAVQETAAEIIDSLGLLDPLLPNLDTPYAEYIFRREQLPDTLETALPTGLSWGSLSTHQHYELVISRTEIPRQVATLASSTSVAAFDSTNVPVAWAFLSVDGSMASLFVEPQWRAKGVGRMVASKILREGMDDEDLGHADVAESNQASRAVCAGLGGVVQGRVYWLRIDLSRLRSTDGGDGH